MATVNPFDLLGDDDTGDLTQLIAAQKLKEVSGLSQAAAKKSLSQAPPAKNAPAKLAKLPSKPLPPSQAVREARSEAPRGGRGGGRGDGRGRGGRGRGGRGFDRDSGDIENSNTTNNGYSGGFRAQEDEDAGRTSERQGYGGYGGTRGGYRGGRRGGFNNEDDSTDGERPPRRACERRSGTGRGNDKREGAGLGNWGTPSDDIVTVIEEPINEGEKIVDSEKQSGEEAAENAKKDSPVTESDEKKEEPEDKEMTLEEYEKVLEEKRKALLLLKSEERKVGLDKEFESMQLLSNKKNDDDAILKLGSDKDKRKEAGDKAKKSVSINEFLKPAEGDNSYRTGGRGRGRGRGRGGGGYGGGEYGWNGNNVEPAPAIEDVGQFPTLGSK